MSKYYVCESECSISTNKCHEKVPSTRLKTEIFASFSKKIRVHALRFWIVFARLCENVILTENGTIFDGNIQFTGIQHRKVIVFKNLRFHPSTPVEQNRVFKTGYVWRVGQLEKKLCFETKTDTSGPAGPNQRQTRGWRLTADGALILAPLSSGALNHCFL